MRDKYSGELEGKKREPIIETGKVSKELNQKRRGREGRGGEERKKRKFL